MITKVSTIRNKLGLHARAASAFVKTAQQYAATVAVTKGPTQADGKNIMSMMVLGAPKGTEIELCVEGDDETQAMAALLELIDQRFGEAE